MDLTGQEPDEAGDNSDGDFQTVDTTKWARPKGS
jgi:hypothetical protein